MAIAVSLAVLFWGWPDFNLPMFFTVWIVWGGGHIVYDYVAHQIVQYYNKDNVVTRDMYR